ncbi:MAG: diguanylate cyclase [Vicinamibacterales bacterium]
MRRPDEMAWWPLRRFLTRPFDRTASPIWATWLGLTLLSVLLAFLEARLNWSGMPFDIGGRALGFTIYPPVAIAAIVVFWLGPTYGATTAYVSTLVSGLAGGLAPARAALFALGTPAELLLLWFLALMLRVRPGLREYRDWWRFGAAAMIAATASSLDIMLYNEAHRLPMAEGQRLWEGWIFGDLALLILVVAPVLRFGWERAHRTAVMRIGAPQRDLSAQNTVLLLGFVWATLAGLALLGLRLLTRALDIPDEAVTVNGDLLMPRINELETFLVVLVGALLLSTMALTAALAGRGEQSAALSLRDDLTGAFNRRAFRGLYEREEERSRAVGRPLSLICFDLDQFKAINDDHGHAAGDRVLTAVTDEVRGLLRAQDLLFRWGGDEFVVLLSHTTRHEAAAIAEQLRVRVSSHVVVEDGDHVSLSIGVASAQPGEISDEELVKIADAAVYQAKSLGRNRVVVAAVSGT